MALRMSLFNIAQPVGAMMSGAMQGALSTNLDGTLGRAGWRWAFLVNVCLSPPEENPELADIIHRVFVRFLWLCSLF